MQKAVGGAVGLEAGEVVGEGGVVVGELPVSDDGDAAVGFADDFPGVGRCDGDGEGAPEEGGLVCAVGGDGFYVIPGEGEGVLVGADGFDFHLVSELAAGGVEFPFTGVGVVGCMERACQQTDGQQCLESALWHECLPGGTCRAVVYARWLPIRRWSVGAVCLGFVLYGRRNALVWGMEDVRRWTVVFWNWTVLKTSVKYGV